MGVLNFRGSPGLMAIINQAQGGDAGNASAAIRALILLGAGRLGYDLSEIQHELVMLMMEPIDQTVMEELRTLLSSGSSDTLPKRPVRERTTRVASAPRPQPERPMVTGPTTPYATGGLATSAGASSAELAAGSGRYDIGEEI